MANYFVHLLIKTEMVSSFNLNKKWKYVFFNLKNFVSQFQVSKEIANLLLSFTDYLNKKYFLFESPSCCYEKRY